MPRKILLLFFVFCYLLLVAITPIFAENAEPSSQSTCDLCGWCNREIQPKPPNWNDCKACLYNPNDTPRLRTYYTVFGCVSTDPSGSQFVKTILSFVFGMAGGIAFLAVLAGSAIVLTSSGNPQRIQLGKDMITSSIFGLLLIVFSVFLLRVVGFDILKIPGFG